MAEFVVREGTEVYKKDRFGYEVMDKQGNKILNKSVCMCHFCGSELKIRTISRHYDNWFCRKKQKEIFDEWGEDFF